MTRLIMLAMEPGPSLGRPVGYATAFLRSFLVMLLLPVLMMDKDTRGVHDRIRHTALVRIR